MRKSNGSWLVSIALGLSAAAGCAGAGGQRSEVDEEGIATVVARVELSDEHYVEVLEWPEGKVSLFEARHADHTQAIASTVEFDPEKRSFASLYEELIELSSRPEASDVAGDLQRLRAIDERFARSAAERGSEAASEQAGPVAVTSQALRRWGDYNANPADWNWFSPQFCRSFTDFCEVGFTTQQVVGEVRHRAAAYFFNEHFSNNDAVLRLQWDPCYDAPIYDFCTDPWKTLVTLRPPFRWVHYTNMWTATSGSGVIKWRFIGSGSHWGWSVLFDN